MSLGLDCIKRIEQLWYGKELSDEKGFVEIEPKWKTKKTFREIHIYKKDGTVERYILSHLDFREYKELKIKFLGLDR